MMRAMVATLTVARITGLLQLGLGLLFWFGLLKNLIPFHMLNGLLFVLALWVLAGLSGRAGAPIGLVLLAFVWGLVVPALGFTHMQILPGPWHWTIRLLHLVVGVVAMGIADRLGVAAGIPRRRGPRQRSPLAVEPARE